MNPDEQWRELLTRRPDLGPGVEAARHYLRKVAALFVLAVSVPLLLLLASAFGFVSFHTAALLCAPFVAVLVALIVWVLVSCRWSFYAARAGSDRKQI